MNVLPRYPNPTLSERLLESPDDPTLAWYRTEEAAAEQPVPFCCPAAAGSRGVHAAPASFQSSWDSAPVWQLSSAHRYLGISSHQVSFCPYCGKPLPKLVRKASMPVPFCVLDDGETHCTTCDQRGVACRCCAPECAWEAEGAPSVFAAVCLLMKTVQSPGKMPRILFLSVSRKGRPSEKGLPGGRIEEGETPEQAARRELAEETGFVVGPMHKVFDALDDAGVRVVCFRAETFSETPVCRPESETGVVEWVAMSDLVGSSPFAGFNTALFNLLGVRC